MTASLVVTVNALIVARARCVNSCSTERSMKCKPLQTSSVSMAASMAAMPRMVFSRNDMRA